IYGQLVPILGKYSKFASAGDKAAVRQAAAAADTPETAEAETAAASDMDLDAPATTPQADTPKGQDAP
ncbi:MAG: inositol monophosphatase, partial [Gammaproteobacteria bacterium]|nr:inositol monophosphatase [Gammaproteobacteria bacterium]